MPELKADLYASDGSSKGSVNLDGAVFGIEPNLLVLHQVVTAQLAGARTGSANTKTRSEVRGGGRKPWRQKGLGRARHGSIRSPQWTGGGVVFGPKPRDYAQRTPKKMKKLALRSAFSSRASEGAVVVAEAFDWDTPRTKSAVAFLERIGATGKVLVVLEPSDRNAWLSFRNLPQVIVAEPGQVTAYDVLWAETVVFTAATMGSAMGAQSYEVSADDFVKETTAPAHADGDDVAAQAGADDDVVEPAVAGDEEGDGA